MHELVPLFVSCDPNTGPGRGLVDGLGDVGQRQVRTGNAGVRVLVDQLDAVAAGVAGVTFLLIRARYLEVGGRTSHNSQYVKPRQAGDAAWSTHSRAIETPIATWTAEPGRTTGGRRKPGEGPRPA